MTAYRNDRDQPNASARTPWLARYLPGWADYGAVLTMVFVFFMVGMFLSAWIVTNPDAEVSAWDMDRAHRETAEARSALYDVYLRLNYCEEARSWEAVR